MDITLEQHGVADGLTFTVLVRNASSSPIIIDEDVACFFVWDISDDAGRSVTPREVLSREEAQLPRLRTLLPGESFSTSMSLDGKGVRALSYARMAPPLPQAGEDAVIAPQAFISTVQFDKAQFSGGRRIALRYDSTDVEMQDAFALLFGRRAEEAGFWIGKAESNVCLIK